MLAAGSSTRMDTWKMVLPWGRSTIVEHSVSTALKVCSRVLIVAGFRGQELAERFRDWPQVEVVQNHGYEAGMFSSIQLGVRAVGEGCFFLALADMPGVSADIYKALADWAGRFGPVFESHGEAYAIIPQFRGKKGHPLFLSVRMRARILQAEIAATLREVLAGVPTVILPVGERGILHDIDTPEDYHSQGPAQPPEDAR